LDEICKWGDVFFTGLQDLQDLQVREEGGTTWNYREKYELKSCGKNIREETVVHGFTRKK
jgi:hypothetical protein